MKTGTGSFFSHLGGMLLCLYILLQHFRLVPGENAMLAKWWTYDGISGPDWWHLKFELCGKGRYQSPIDIKPDKLLFDPSLSAIIFSSDKKLNGNLTNTGNDITYFIDESLVLHINATAGPLQYVYHLHQIKFHFGRNNASGSEHTVNGLSFPAEVHILAYNADLYSNFSQALDSPNGIVVFAIFLEISENPNEAFTMIADSLKEIQSRDESTWISGLPLNILLPKTHQYITYEGSLTQPGCQETVTWVIFNKPIYVLGEQLYEMRTLNREGGPMQHVLIHGNIRPSQPLNNRLLRTNINYRPKKYYQSVKQFGS